MEDRYPDVDPEEAEYVDYMLATGEGPIGGGLEAGGAAVPLPVELEIT